jgi:hypothetical protein
MFVLYLSEKIFGTFLLVCTVKFLEGQGKKEKKLEVCFTQRSAAQYFLCCTNQPTNTTNAPTVTVSLEVITS